MMTFNNILTKAKNIHKRLNGSTIQYDISEYRKMAFHVISFRKTIIDFSDEQLLELSVHLKKSVITGSITDELLIQSYGLVMEAIWRVLKIEPFEVQIIAAIALHYGKLIEMQTGEGKTLSAIFAAYVNSLSGKGVHVLTFNDYLAQRDTLWMGPVYRFLGLSVGCIQESMNTKSRQVAYNADITYLTAKESGFDYLRDNLCYSKDKRVHREFYYAIIDEADSILIDESRNPLIIAGEIGSDSSSVNLLTMSNIVKQLKEKVDFDFDNYARNIYLTEMGIARVEHIVHCTNLYAEENTEILMRLNYALHAEYLLHIDKDYIVRNGSIEIIDELTGRVADQRRWPDGLHAAVEAKEQCIHANSGRILNTISLQHFLQHYPRLCGMTATAQAAEEEFVLFYGLHIVVIPPNKACIRNDLHDILLVTKSEKQQAIIEEITNVHATGRPVLVGTQSVDESANLAESLKLSGIDCRVLNAKNDEEEAKIIALAGKKNAVTISTNMAGRGTDIRLGADDNSEMNFVKNAGGLHLIGTNRYESRRIDNQLRGRAGRQGDPGSSVFFVSLEDNLFVKYRLKELLPQLTPYAVNNQNAIQNPVVKNEINRVQRIIEGQNLEIKTTLYKYTLLLEQQRQIISDKRNLILENGDFLDLFKANEPDKFNFLTNAIGYDQLLETCRIIALIQIDNRWADYLSAISDLREGIHLRRIGGQNPLFEFRKISIEIFNEMLSDIDKSTLKVFNSITNENYATIVLENSLKMPSATWTYLVSDNPFEKLVQIEIGTNINSPLGILGALPFLLIVWIIRKVMNYRKKKNLDSAVVIGL